MTDYFAYNGEDVVPTYMPGVPSYGQEGSEGNTGDVGPFVYYTSYTLPEDLARCNAKIKSNKLLSNNLDKDSYNKYMEGDLVIDSLGNIYKIELIDGILMIPVDADVHDSTALGGEIFSDFKCKVSTSFIRNSARGHKITNPYYGESINSYKLYHSQVLQKNVYGNWITFSIRTLGTSNYSFVYYFNLVLPNGEVLRKISLSPSATMFVDNKYLYGCYGCADTNIIDDDYAKLIFGKDVSNILGNSTVNDLINYRSFDDNDEKNMYATILISYFIHKYCTAYVEIYNENSGKVYRYDLNEIIPVSPGSAITDDETEYIDPYISQISWDYDTDSSYNAIIPKPHTVETPDSITYHRTFKNYIACRSRENGSDEDPENEYISAAYYNFIQDFYFVDETGFNIPDNYQEDRYVPDIYRDKGFEDIDDIEHAGTPLYLWLTDGASEKTSTIKVKFINVSKFALNIRFNSFINSNQESAMPYTMIYIGYPNVNLWQQGDENGNVALDRSVLKKQSEGKEAYDGSTGVYYLYKIIPYGLELNDGTDTASVADAGFSIVTVDLTQFDLLDLTKENWIEIGVMMFGNNKNEEHRPSIFPMNNYTNALTNGKDNWFNEDITDANRLPLGSIWPDVCYSFTEISKIRNTSILNSGRFSEGKVEENSILSENNKASNPSFDGGLSDVTMFINNIVELTNDKEEESEDAIANSSALELEQYIDYVGNGLKWDSSTYTVYKNNNSQE